MAPDRFDRHIRSKIYDLETPVPEALWAKIDQEIRPQKRRRPLLWIFFGLFTLTIVGVLSKSTLNGGQDSVVTLGSSLDDVTTLSVAPTTNTTISSNSSTVIKHEVPIHSKIQNQTTSIKRASASKEVPKGQSNSRPFSDAATLSVPGSQSEFATRLDHRLNPLASEGAKEGTRALQPEDLEVSKPDKPSKIQFISNLGSRHFQVESLHKDPITNNCPSFRAKKFLRPFAELTLSGGLPLRDLTVIGTEASDYLNMRLRTEQVRSMFSIQGVIGADIGPHWEAKVGLSFSQINEVFDFIDENSTRTYVNYIIDTVRDNSGNILEIRSDSSVVTEYGQRIKLSNNYFRFLDIPALIGYRFKIKNHGFILQAGAAVNLAFWKEVDLLAPDESIVNADSNNPSAYPIFRSRAGLDLIGGIGYSLELSERNVIRLMASARYPTSSLTLNEYPLEQKYTQVKLGLSWKHYLW